MKYSLKYDLNWNCQTKFLFTALRGKKKNPDIIQGLHGSKDLSGDGHIILNYR